MLEISVPAGTAEAWVSRPADGQERPGVLFFMDAIGLRPQIETMAERIAGWGYVVLAPNVFHRAGSVAELAPRGDLTEPGAREAFMAAAMTRVRALTTDLAVPDIAAYLQALRELPGVGPGPLGATGYCMGARLAMRAACLHPDEVAACGCFHGGGLVTDAEDSPHLGLGAARAEFVCAHADADRSMPPEAVDTLGEALTEAGLAHVNEVYAGSRARLHDGGHLGVRRGGRRAPLRRPAGPAGPDAGLSS